MDMKKLLSIVSAEKQATQLNESLEECGMPPGGMSAPSTPPVSMSVNLNAQGVENIKDLLNLMRAAEAPRMSEPMAMPQPGIGMPIKITKVSSDEPESKPAGSDGADGMAQIRDLIKKADTPKSFDNEPEEAYSGVDSVTSDAGGGVNGPKDPADIRIKDPSPYSAEEYANEPDEKYSDHTTMIKDLAGGLNREKQQYAKAQDGDNAMAVKETVRKQLDTLYKQIKEAKIEASGVRAGDKKKGKVDKSERKQYFVKLEKEGKTKGMTIVADEGESQGEVRDRAARDAKSGGWTVASIRVKEED
jgi:hypothetical protein